MQFPTTSTRSSSTECETKSRVILSNAEGVSITACPLSDNSAQNSYVEMFSAGWHDQHNFEEPIISRAISVEYINPDHEEYSFTWLEMVPRPPLGLVVRKCCEVFKWILAIILIFTTQLTVNSAVQDWRHA